jgi:hypothetical protein
LLREEISQQLIKSFQPKVLFSEANERWMKHGTKVTNPQTIVESAHGVDFTCSKGGMFGNASYTAEDAGYSHTYRFHIGYSEAQMFLVRVAAGKVHKSEPDSSLTQPPNNHDSIEGIVSGDKKAIMVYRLDSIYPAYLLTYSF